MSRVERAPNRWRRLPAVVLPLLLVAPARPEREQAPRDDPPRLVLSEIHYHPPNDADRDEEFVELHNPTGAVVRLMGWEVRNGIRFRFDGRNGPEEIPPGGYVLLARNPPALARITGVDPSRIAGPYDGKLSNFSDRLELVDPDGRVVETVEYAEGGDWPARADGLGSSLQRVAMDAPASVPWNWRVSEPTREEPEKEIIVFDTGAPVRWFENRDGRAPDFEGNVPWYHQDFDADANGWRAGRTAVGYDTSGRSRQGWIRTDATPRRGLHSILVRLQFEVKEEYPEGFEVPRLSMDWDDGVVVWLDGVEIARRNLRSARGQALPPGGTYLGSLHEAGGDCMPEPSWEVLWRGSLAALAPGRHLLAFANYNANSGSSDLFATAKLSLGHHGGDADFTPGRANSVAAPELPAGVRFLDRFPEEPRSSDRVRIRARVEGPADEVILFHDRGGGEESSPMRDDGRDGDDTGGDGVWTGAIPPADDLTVVRFRIESRRGTARSSFPRRGNPSRYAGYYVVDEPPAPNEDVDVYHILWDGPLSCAEGKWLENCTLVFRGTAYLDVRLKYRGDTSCGRPKTGLRVAFNKGDRFGNARRLNFLAGWEDKSMLREVLAWGLYRDVGHPSCRARFAAVHGNGNRFHGLFVALEDPSSAYLTRNGFRRDDALWKCRNAMKDGSTGSYEKLTAEGDEDHWLALSELGEKLNTLEGRELIDYLLEHLDVESIIDYMSVKRLTSDEDGHEKNWLLCRGTRIENGEKVRRWAPHPWDLDLSFGQIHLGSDRIHTDRPLLMHTRDYPRSRDGWNGIIEAVFGRRADDYFMKALHGRIWRLLEEAFHPRALGEVIDRLDRNTIELARKDLERWPRWGLRPRDPSFHRDRLREYVRKRRLYLRDLLTREHPTTDRNTSPARREVEFELPDGERVRVLVPAARGTTRRTFRYTPAPRLRITEVHARPAGGDDHEFVELHSLEGEAVDLSGWMVPAVGYVFPAGSRAPPRGTLVLARRPDGLRARHPHLAGAIVFGPYEGNLADEGEDLRLQDSGMYLGRRYYPETIDLVRYRDGAPWPELEEGASLELRDTSLWGELPGSWKESVAGGTPGRLP